MNFQIATFTAVYLRPIGYANPWGQLTGPVRREACEFCLGAFSALWEQCAKTRENCHINLVLVCSVRITGEQSLEACVEVGIV